MRVVVIRGRRLPADRRRVLQRSRRNSGAGVPEPLSATAQAERVSEVSDLRAAILSAVSHDLRTPLASIKAAASSPSVSAMSHGTMPNATSSGTIEEETDRLTDLVANLLDMSRLQSGMLLADRAGRAR